MTDVGQDDPPIGKRVRAGKKPVQTPMQRALGLLTRREHSRKELILKLAARGVDADEAAQAVQRLQQAGWQDDHRFAEALLRSRVGNGYGPVRIRAELATHGLDTDVVARIVDAYEGDWDEDARSLVERRFGGVSAPDRKLRHKAAEFLLRRGFTNEQARRASRFDQDD